MQHSFYSVSFIRQVPLWSLMSGFPSFPIETKETRGFQLHMEFPIILQLTCSSLHKQECAGFVDLHS